MPGPSLYPLCQSPRVTVRHQRFSLNSNLILMNSQDGESLSRFWDLYFSFSLNSFIQMATEPL